MPAVILAFLVVGVSVALSLAALALVQRRVPLAVLKESTEVAGFTVAVVGVAYTVLLAFAVTTVWAQHDAAQRTVEREANALADLARVARKPSSSPSPS